MPACLLVIFADFVEKMSGGNFCRDWEDKFVLYSQSPALKTSSSKIRFAWTSPFKTNCLVMPRSSLYALRLSCPHQPGTASLTRLFNRRDPGWTYTRSRSRQPSRPIRKESRPGRRISTQLFRKSSASVRLKFPTDEPRLRIHFDLHLFSGFFNHSSPSS